MSFPKTLDDAYVLYYTPKACFGDVRYTTGKIAAHIRYLAICKYDDGNSFFLFGCNADYDVVSDLPLCSVAECMRVAEDTYDCAVSWIEMA